jgi:hypothetical protein
MTGQMRQSRVRDLCVMQLQALDVRQRRQQGQVVVGMNAADFRHTIENPRQLPAENLAEPGWRAVFGL